MKFKFYDSDKLENWKQGMDIDILKLLRLQRKGEFYRSLNLKFNT